MRGMIFKGDCKVEVSKFPDPSPGPGEAVIEMKASGMCGTDLHYFRHGMRESLTMLGMADRMAPGDVIGGHEPCGVVVAIGAGEDTGFKIGDRVIVFHYKGCSHCEQCRTGWTQLCDRGARIYGVLDHGGHADLMKVPISSLIHLPQDMSFKAGAAVACGTGTAYGALLRLDVSARDTLAIFGLGPVGLSAAQLASAMGIEVIGVDVNSERAAASKAFGVAHTINATDEDPVEQIHKLTQGKGVSCAIDCAGGEDALTQSVRSTKMWGRIALVGVGNRMNLDPMKDLITKQRTLIGSFTVSEVGMQACADFIAGHGVEVDRLFTDEWQLSDAQSAYEAFDKQTGGKSVFVF